MSLHVSVRATSRLHPLIHVCGWVCVYTILRQVKRLCASCQSFNRALKEALLCSSCLFHAWCHAEGDCFVVKERTLFCVCHIFRVTVLILEKTYANASRACWYWKWWTRGFKPGQRISSEPKGSRQEWVCLRCLEISAEPHKGYSIGEWGSVQSILNLLCRNKEIWNVVMAGTILSTSTLMKGVQTHHWLAFRLRVWADLRFAHIHIPPSVQATWVRRGKIMILVHPSSSSSFFLSLNQALSHKHSLFPFRTIPSFTPLPNLPVDPILSLTLSVSLKIDQKMLWQFRTIVIWWLTNKDTRSKIKAKKHSKHLIKSLLQPQSW